MLIADKFKCVLLFSLILLLSVLDLKGQEVEKKVILQAFWWDYENNNYSDSWANYLADLAPRLKGMGIDAVWIPPTYKNSYTSSTGYAPFDHYDLGDKYQKGWNGQELDISTRVGTKDEVLRMIAIMHSNGIEVIQDIALNHVTGAGTGSNGSGGLDPEPQYSMASNNGFKNFRYACYETPVEAQNACDYADRKGRWPKNYMNFHPNAFHNENSGDWEADFWGPDLSYGIAEDGTANGHGISSNICSYATCIDECHNPEQAYNYNRDGAREWIKWFKKQTNVDGYRWDAVKHFPYFVQQDLSHNCKYTVPSWAAGGTEMFNVGEYVGSKNELDAFVDDVTYSNGGSEMLMGTFDFGLRAFDSNGGVNAMVSGNGFFDMATLPAAQQERRFSDFDGKRVHRTVPFVNNHDTFRPVLDANGNYQDWNSGSELSPHIDPYNIRMPLAYAVVLAVDGNPQIFMEDLFDLGANGNRFAHDPKSTDQNTGLPTRNPIVNLIWCHQNLGFKNGDYKVRSTASSGNVFFNPGSSANDLLAIERSGKAIIGLNDREDEWQSCYVDTDFAPGTVLVDYSGANGATTYVVPADGRVNVNTPPVDPSQGWYGYAVWAPEGQENNNYTPNRTTLTSQEWEMANDLGDSHCKSLGQGGMIPANSCSYRIAGKYYPMEGSEVSITVFKTDETQPMVITAYDASGDILSRISGNQQPLEMSYNATSSEWHTLKVRNLDDQQTGQIVYARVDYTAPEEINAVNDFAIVNAAMWNGNAGTCDWADCANWDEGFVPNTNTLAIIPECVMVYPCIPQNHPTSLIDDRSELIIPTEDLALNRSLKIQPNPFHDILTLECSDCIGNYSLRMIDISGKVILEFQDQTINDLNNGLTTFTKDLHQGIYFVQIIQDGIASSHKIVKN